MSLSLRVLCVVQVETLKEKIKILEERQKNVFCAKCGKLVAGYDRHAVLDGDPFRCSPLCFDDTHTLHEDTISHVGMYMYMCMCVCIEL